jgi:hypothetical protein
MRTSSRLEDAEPEGVQVKREREGTDDAELERLTRDHHDVAGLKSPHENTLEFLNLGIDEDELTLSRQAELDQLDKFQVYEEVSAADYPGVKVIGTTWVDRRISSSLVKSRLCAQEFATKKSLEYYSATPSTAYIRVIDFLIARYNLESMIADVSGAFLHTPTPADLTLLVRPPPESRAARRGLVWRLTKMLYGLRSSPQAWQDHLHTLLSARGYERSRHEPCLYFHLEHRVFILTYVDDLHACGPREHLLSIVSELSAHLIIKASGPFVCGDSYTFLRQSRLVRGDAVYILPDETYVLECQKDLQLEECRPASTPGLQDRGQLHDDEIALVGDEIRLFRSCVGRLLYLSHSRADLQCGSRSGISTCPSTTRSC